MHKEEQLINSKKKINDVSVAGGYFMAKIEGLNNFVKTIFETKIKLL